MIKLEQFQQSDFERLISWIDTKELLITIAGTVFTYPLTFDQLKSYLDDPKSYSFNIVDVAQNKIIGHAEIVLSNDNICKIDKLLIGDRSNRGKGIGQEVINELLKYSFESLGARIVELNVYDWNIGAIRCYEKAGFTKNSGKTFSTQFDDKTWLALNMTIDKEKWINQKQSHFKLDYSRNNQEKK
jgi:RimJ/RimL family protein N-acetyltransferase